MNRLKSLTKKFTQKGRVRNVLFLIGVPATIITVLCTRIFNTRWYADQTALDSVAVSNRLFAATHYAVKGRRRGHTPSPFFVPEFFDRRNWRRSIIDPIVRYSLQSKNWQLPTSILYQPQSSDYRRFSSPLNTFLKTLSDETEITFTSTTPNGTGTYTWRQIRALTQTTHEEFYEQERLRREMLPVSRFDFGLQERTITEHSSFDVKLSDAPYVSIITPVWNRASEVTDAITSVQNQTFEDWELIIIDDGSTDASVDVVTAAMKKDSRITLLQPGRGGVCKARNAGLEYATGEWIAFLDSDNTWTPDFLKTVVASAIATKKSAAYSAIKMEDNGGIRYRTTPPNKQRFALGNYVDLNSFIVTRNVLEGVGFFDESLRRMVDYDLICRISKVVDLEYVPIIGVNYIDHSDANRITTTELVSWDGVVKNNNFIDWESLQRIKRKKGLTSVIIPIVNDIYSTLQTIHRLRTTPVAKEIEIILADSSSTANMNATLGALSAVDDRISYHRFPASKDNTLGANYGFSVAQGETIIILDQYTDVETTDITALINGVVDEQTIVAPLQLKPTRTIFSAGVGFIDNTPTPINLLENHPESDVRTLTSTYNVPAAAHGCIALHASLFAKLKGFYPLLDKGFEYQDFCLRAAEVGATTSIIPTLHVVNFNTEKGWGSTSQQTFYSYWGEPRDTMTELLKRAGFGVSQYTIIDPRKGRLSKIEPILHVEKPKKGMYRWAIKISAPSDERRHAWGDVYYAEGLRDSLEALGQSVAIDYRESHYRSTSYLDDINIDIRGLDNYIPQPNAINLLWVISHPERVTKQIIQGFDRSYGAGSDWVEHVNTQYGADMRFLPQCTDTKVFIPPKKLDARYNDQIIFVGNSRNVVRPVVRDSIAAGLDVHVYGGGWEGLIDPRYVKATFIPNKELSLAYGSSRIVLNDHWQDMKDWGFISNRIFDAAATGAKIITDDVAGVEELLGRDTVRTYRTKEDLVEIAHSDWAKEKLSAKSAQRNHTRIQKEHSFDARAKTLLADIASLRKY